MQVIRHLSDVPADLKGSVISFGVFDSVHLGHQKIISDVVLSAKNRKLTSIIVTFFPNPVYFIDPAIKVGLNIQELSNKIKLIENLGVDLLVVLSFNIDLYSLSADDFVKNILINKLKMKHIIVGDDCRFGANRTGNIDLLSKLSSQEGFSVSVCPKINNSQMISSTNIRNFIRQGDFQSFYQATGYYHNVTGVVVHGQKMGTKLGFPTANIEFKSSKLVKFPYGIYKVFVGLTKDGKNRIINEREYLGVCSWGVRPTVCSDEIPVLEVYILDFNDIIYGDLLKVSFVEYIRAEEDFKSLDALKLAISNDIKKVRLSK